MGDWEKAKQKFDELFERECREADRLQKIGDDLREQARRLEQRAKDLAERGKLAQALATLKRAEAAQARADRADDDNRGPLTLLRGAIIGKLETFAIFSAELGPR